MNGVLVDSNVLLDLVLNDPNWADWSEQILGRYAMQGSLFINATIYTEVSIGFKRIEELEAALQAGGFKMLEMPKEALFLAGKVFLDYRRNSGTKRSLLPDFYIGAQAAVMQLDLVTRDVNRYRTYFPTVTLVSP